MLCTARWWSQEIENFRVPSFDVLVDLPPGYAHRQPDPSTRGPSSYLRGLPSLRTSRSGVFGSHGRSSRGTEDDRQSGHCGQVPQDGSGRGRLQKGRKREPQDYYQRHDCPTEGTDWGCVGYRSARKVSLCQGLAIHARRLMIFEQTSANNPDLRPVGCNPRSRFGSAGRLLRGDRSSERC